MTRKLTTEQFIAKAREVHGDTYDYSQVSYVSAKIDVTILCPTHGAFQQQPYTHTGQRCGCPPCGNIKNRQASALGRDEFIAKAWALHGSRFDYAKVVYANYDTKVLISCPDHGEFLQSPAKHLSTTGCPACGRLKQAANNKARSVTGFLARADVLHGPRYDYSQVRYTGVFDPVIIICRDHGSFQQTPDNHLHGHGCPLCGISERAEANFDAHAAKFLPEALAMHGDRYDYVQAVYKGATTPLTIVCTKHGPFEQSPSNHLKGCGCPTCGFQDSKGERELFAFISTLFPDAARRDTTVLGGKEIDILIPSKRVGIEYNGIYYHSDAFVPRRRSVDTLIRLRLPPPPATASFISMRTTGGSVLMWSSTPFGISWGALSRGVPPETTS